jgi:flagellar biosynthesis/type III secretory pathway protein FliH
MQHGLQQGMQHGLQQGMQHGLQQGMQHGLQQGMRHGLQQGVQNTVLRQLIRRFGEPPTGITAKLNSLTQDSLDDLAIELFDFTSYANFERWLSRH